MTEDSIQLKNIDPDDISDALGKIETSFGFKFGKADLNNIETFGELSEMILSKMNSVHVNDCTTQQAFYKIRDAMVSTLKINKAEILRQTELDQMFNQKNRRQKVKIFENALGFSIDILELREWQKWLLFIGMCGSLTMFFIKWQFALVGLCAFILLGWILNKFFATEIKKQTVGQLAQKLTKEKYNKVRRNSLTLNKIEVEHLVRQIFSEELVLDESKLTSDATF